MKHRGPDPADATLFGPEQLPALRDAVADLSWLLARGYNDDSALTLVGNRFQLTARQRMAVRRATCTEAERTTRQAKQVSPRGEPVCIDGFNLLIAIERAMSGGPVFVGLDTAIRDLGGVHGTYRLVSQTPDAIGAIGRTLAALHTGPVTWLLDQPVSNSGRLAAALRDAAQEQGWDWTVEVVPRPDPVLAASADVVVTGDAWILDQCARWFNLHAAVLDAEVPDAWRITLGDAGS